MSSRDILGNRNDFYDGLDYMYDRGIEDNFEDDFVLTHRRYKERSAAAFAEDLAELRRKRRDMQDRIFDVIDLNAEIEKAKNTLEAADNAFQRHATKFDNTDNNEDVTLKKGTNMEIISEKPMPKTMKWIKIPNADIDLRMPQPSNPRQDRTNSLVEAAAIEDPLNTLALLPLKRKFLKRKKSVSF
ncbi:uncharacterized protein LOC143144414 isoform X1 [Ptiloglossa arizonensis]|uniref:uncharacterized protein LOC143144414 isoform X1 n=2 Tax=Ptiloglossa arizonensis TaxID=3350558 RepID=UPI003F9F0CA1